MDETIRKSYDALAREYAEHLFDELDGKPLDRELLDGFAERVRGRVCDLGCGPGHVARYLHERGVDVFGLDLSPGMVEEARRRTPEVEFVAGDMRRLAEIVDAEASGGLAGIVAFYALVHVAKEDLEATLADVGRALAPDGLLLVALHVGDEVRHVEDLWGEAVSLDFVFFEVEELERALETSGFVIEELLTREPYPDVEVATRRIYALARRA
jgi:SAM-dependent methyltransferase